MSEEILSIFEPVSHNMHISNALVLIDNGYGPTISESIANCYDLISDMVLENGEDYIMETILVPVIPIPNVMMTDIIERTILTRAINEAIVLIGPINNIQEGLNDIFDILYVEKSSGKYSNDTIELFGSPELRTAVGLMYNLYLLVNHTYRDLWSGIVLGYLEDKMVLVI